MKMSKAIRDYIADNDIDINELSTQTGISVDELKQIAQAPFDADEMMNICRVLQLEPEELWRKIKVKS